MFTANRAKSNKLCVKNRLELLQSGTEKDIKRKIWDLTNTIRVPDIKSTSSASFLCKKMMQTSIWLVKLCGLRLRRPNPSLQLQISHQSKRQRALNAVKFLREAGQLNQYRYKNGHSSNCWSHSCFGLIKVFRQFCPFSQKENSKLCYMKRY